MPLLSGIDLNDPQFDPTNQTGVNPYDVNTENAQYIQWQQIHNAAVQAQRQQNVIDNAQQRGRQGQNQGMGFGLGGQGANAGNNRGNGYGFDPSYWAWAQMMNGGANALGDMAQAGASMWNSSQNGLANIAQAQIAADTQRQLGQQALQNQAKLYGNQFALGQGALGNQRDLTMAGYQNNLDRINATFKGINPLMGEFTSGLGQAFGGLSNGLLGGGASGALTGFQSTNGVSATLPGQGGGNATYNTGIGQQPAMPAAQRQANVAALGNVETNSAPGLLSAQTTPAQRTALANQTAARSAQGANAAATNLDRYQQAAEAKLGYDQQAQNSQTANALQSLMNRLYGGGLYRDQRARQAQQQASLGRMHAAGNLLSGTMNGVGGLVGGLLG